MSLNSYLQKNYLTPTSKGKKAKKEKRDRTVIVDNELITAPVKKKAKVFPNKISLLPKSTGTKGWKIVGSDETISPSPAPSIPIELTTSRSPTPQMTSGASSGLQTGAQVAEQIRAKEESEKIELAKLNYGSINDTVFRDVSGRKIDIERMRIEEKSKKEDIEKTKERKKREMNMGLVQKLMLEKSRYDLERAGNSLLTRYADDDQLNEELKKKNHKDDPLASFNPPKSERFVSLTGRKLYKGGYPQNRFGIVPGYRWDGVDRSNGFESRWFKKQIEREQEKKLSYTMQED